MWSKQNYFCWGRSVWKEVMTSSDLSICFVVCLFICFVLFSSIWTKQTYLYLVTLTPVEVALQLLNGHAFCSLCDEDCYSHNKKLHLWRCVSVKDGFWTLSLIHVPQGISFLHQIRGAQMSLEDIKTQSLSLPMMGGLAQTWCRVGRGAWSCLNNVPGWLGSPCEALFFWGSWWGIGNEVGDSRSRGRRRTVVTM